MNNRFSLNVKHKSCTNKKIYNLKEKQNQESYPCELFIAKVSNDNRSDIVVKWRDEGNVALLTYRGTSTGTFLEGNDSYLYDEIAYYQSNT